MSSNNEIKCPYNECPDKYHPDTMEFCPNTGKRLKRGWKRIVEPMKGSFALILSIYALLCSVYSDIIIQNGNSSAIWPIGLYGNNELKLDSDNILYNNVPREDEKKIYIFVLDCSSSVNNIIESDILKEKYRTEFKNFGGYLTQRGYRPKEKPSLIDLAKVRIGTTLFKLLDESKKDTKKVKDEFCIWRVEDEASTIYPPIKRKSDLEEDKVLEAVEFLLKTPNGSKNTDFENLLQRLYQQYDAFRKQESNQYSNPEITLVVFSDFIHDVDEKYTKQEQSEDIREQLVKKIQEVSSANIMMNFVILNEKELDIQKTIFPIFEKSNIYWFRLNKYPVNSDECNDLSYSAITAKENIKFYYVNSIRTDKSSFVLDHIGKSKIKVDIPSKIGDLFFSDFALYCEHLNSSGEPKNPGKSGKMIVSGGQTFEIEPDPDDQLRFSYSGRIPLNTSNPLLRLSVVDTDKTYLIPIDFVKRPSTPGVLIMIFFYLLMWIWGLRYTVLWGLHLYNKRKEKLDLDKKYQSD
jgi:hypothetical protein